VVIQEIFGVSEHIKERCETFAAAGYDTIAPSLFDRIERWFSGTLDDAGSRKGRAAVDVTPWKQVVADLQSAIDVMPGPVFVTGFCWGGAATWLAAARCHGLTAASAFYGRMINQALDDAPRIPTILHYGARDISIPAAARDEVHARYPQIPLFLYDAGHGFCRQGSDDFDSASCELATQRTLDHFAAFAP
jgi:carboxymethylenebutenolidase